MNYIKKIMEDNNLKFNERFKIIPWMIGDGRECIVYIDESYILFSASGNLAEQDDMLLIRMIKDLYKIEKIKPKTLMEQLMRQGFGWIIWNNGDINKAPYTDGTLENAVRTGNMFLTKSDAEREVYRRGLEFEMQEWARENDCLGDYDDKNVICLFDGFNVFINTNREGFRHKFNDKARKYYNWSDDNND